MPSAILAARCTVIQITNNTPPLTFYPTPEDKLQPTWDGRARDYPPLSPLFPPGRHRASSNYSSWGNRVSWTRLIPVVARPLGRHTELTRQSVFMDQARPDIPRKRRQIVPSLSPSHVLALFPPSVRLASSMFLFPPPWWRIN